MSLGFPDPMRLVPDHRIPGMAASPLDEVFLATPVAACAEGPTGKGFEEVAAGTLDSFAHVVPTAQVFRMAN
jgi:hypothetical protein